MASSIPARNIRLKRAYEAPSRDDGARVLVDRLWPRGISKQKAALDQWMKEIAPSTELREWFGHDPARWAEFQKRYAAELRAKRTGLAELRAIARRGKLTLIYAAQDEQPRVGLADVVEDQDEQHNHAVVLRNVLLGR